MYAVNSVSLTFQFQQFATRVLSILHTTFTPHHETKVAHYQFSLPRTSPRIMTTSLIMALPPVFVTSFLHEAIVIITIIFEIMILISNLRSRRYSRAQGGKLEIPPAQKLSILSSAHRAHGSAHTNVFALENQSEREFLIMLLAGLQCSKRCQFKALLHYQLVLQLISQRIYFENSSCMVRDVTLCNVSCNLSRNRF